MNTPLALADLLYEKSFTCALKDLLWWEKHLSQWLILVERDEKKLRVILLYLPAGFRSFGENGGCGRCQSGGTFSLQIRVFLPIPFIGGE